MPLYMCNAKAGAINEVARHKIAKDITQIHCKVTNAPPTFVHAFFFENASHLPLESCAAIVFGTIRHGRNEKQRQQIVDEITKSVHLNTGIALGEISTVIAETPASWVMEGGDLLPEPGEEAEWLRCHDEKLAANS